MSRTLHVNEQMPQGHMQQTSLGNVQTFYNDLENQLDNLLLGEHEAKDAMALAIATGGNIALFGEPAGGKTTLGQDARRAIGGLDNLVVIPERSDLKISQLLGGESTQIKTTNGQNREVNTFLTEAILTSDAQAIWSDEFNHLPTHVTNSLSEALEARRFKNTEGASVALNGLEYVAIAMNPGRARHGQFAVKPSVATRFPIGVMMGQFKDQAEKDQRILQIAKHGWTPRPENMQPIVDIEGLHAVRNFINGGNIAFPDSLDKEFTSKVSAADEVLRESGFGESVNRIAKQTVSNARALAAFSGEKSLTPETIDRALRFVVAARVGMLSVNAVEEMPQIIDRISS